MSKLAIVLCALLCASAANGFFWSKALTTVQNKAEELTNAAIYEVEGRIQASQNVVQELAGNLVDEAMKLSGRVQDEIKQVLQKAENEIAKYSSTVAVGIDVAECSKSLRDLDKAALAVMSEISVCVTEKLEAGSGYVESVFQVSRDALGSLSEISLDTRYCIEQVTGIRSTLSAISCSRTVATKAAWMIPKIISTMTVKISELTFMLGTLKPSLAYCMATNGLMAFYRESSVIVEKAKKCIQQKVDKAYAPEFPVYETPKQFQNPREFLPYPDDTNEGTTMTEQKLTYEKESTNEYEYTPEKVATTEHNFIPEKIATEPEIAYKPSALKPEQVFVDEQVATTEHNLIPKKIVTELEIAHKPDALKPEKVFIDEPVAATEQVFRPKKVATTERLITDEQVYITDDVVESKKVARTEKVQTEE